MSSQKKISSFFMKKANDETIQPGSAGDQGSEELKTGAVADVDVKVIPLESNEPETLMPSSLPAKHLQGMMSWMNDSEKIQLSTDLRAIIDRTVEEWKTSGELFENSTIFDSPIKEGLKTSPRLKNVSSVVFSFKLSKFVLADLKQDLGSHGGGTDEALVNILTSVTNRPDSKSNFQSIEVKCFEDIIREVTNIIKAGVELEDTNPAYTTSVTDETDEVEPEDSASCDHVETILESDDDDDDDDDYSVVSDSTVSSIYSTDGQGGGDVTDVFPKGPGALRRPMTADVSCQVFSYPPSLDARPTGPESLRLRRATSKGIVQESSSRDFRMPSPTIGDEDSASCDHVETILESGDVTDVFPKGPGALRRPMTADVSCQVFSYPPSLDDDDESVVSGSTVSSIYSTDGQGEGDVTDEFPNCTVSSIYSTDGQGEGDVTDVFPKGPGDGFAAEFLSRDDEVTAGSGADFPGLRSFLAEDEAEEEEETEVTLVQHAAQTSPIIVHRAYYASSCGSL